MSSSSAPDWGFGMCISSSSSAVGCGIWVTQMHYVKQPGLPYSEDPAHSFVWVIGSSSCISNHSFNGTKVL